MNRFRAYIEGKGTRSKRGPDDPSKATNFPGAPLMSLKDGNYYLVAIMDPCFQVAVMRLQHWYGGTERAYWEPYIPERLPIGDAHVIALLDLGDKVTL